MQLRALALADSDSYLKWAAGLLAQTPWQHEVVVLRTDITPSAAQRAAAVRDVPGAAPAVRSLAAVLLRLRQDPPDILLLACTGPVVDVVVRLLRRSYRGGRRPVVVTGLPGLCWPGDAVAWQRRIGVDVFVVHSERERESFAELGVALGATGEVALARLPSLRWPAGSPAEAAAIQAAAARDAVVFAAQAKVPARREDRLQVLRTLDVLARARPDLRPVVKLRTRAGEFQTHAERHPYDLLWDELVRDGEVQAGSVELVDGAMGALWPTARALVTVSSTAALEAMAAGVPTLVLSDFGVGEAELNLTFVGSGAIGDLADLAAGRFHRPDPTWAKRNYFHDAKACDWVAQVEGLALLGRQGRLPQRPLEPIGVPAVDPRRRRSLTVRLLLPTRLSRAVRAARRLVRRVRTPAPLLSAQPTQAA